LWSVISNGRFATQIKQSVLRKLLSCTPADVVAANVSPELLAYRERVRLAAQGAVAGFRRFYCDCIEPVPVGVDWPDHLFVRTEVLSRLLPSWNLPQSFPALLENCRSASLQIVWANVGGSVCDLATEDGLLNCCLDRLSLSSHAHPCRPTTRACAAAGGSNGEAISEDARFVGPVLLGDNVRIGPRVVVVGPTIIADEASIAEGAVIDASVIGPGVSTPPNQLVQNRFAVGPKCNWSDMGASGRSRSHKACLPGLDAVDGTFRSWPRLSYPGCLKRLIDCVVAVVVLILFAPVLPLIALAVKLSSPGQVFFKDKRQGLHGKEFNCLKFRSMIVGSDKMQEKLRVANQADGPQFKMANDPRLSAIGKFLRDTYIDEIPQFFNVLLGQMGIVGPRPSPESENTLCPSWRYARLSVRPGITGLWQVRRTRRRMKDFQEWIHYDVKYVRDLSFRLDLWICWKTAGKILKSFVSQF
jgi:lipopolysaccharide/colanic/teichoic acid biosynthesis glycosyltransferase